MERQYTNTDCALYGTAYCERLNMRNCEACPAKDRGRAAGVREDLDAVAALLPAEDLSSLFHTDRCVLCKGEPNPKACYAMADLGNPEPEREGRNFIGMKTKMRVGSLIPVQMSCCAACRRKHRLLTYIPVLVPLAVGILLLALLSVAAVREAVATAHPALPLGVFLLVVAVALAGARLWQGALLRRYSRETYVNVMEQPFLAEMGKRGWFELQRGKRMSHLVFSKERLKQGVYTR